MPHSTSPVTATVAGCHLQVSREGLEAWRVDSQVSPIVRCEPFAGLAVALGESSRFSDLAPEPIAHGFTYRGRFGTHAFERRIEDAGDGWIVITSRVNLSTSVTIDQAIDRFDLAFDPTWCWSPSVGGFNSDAQYKAPLILAQRGPLCVGIVPDCSRLDRTTLTRCAHALDLDAPKRTLSVGFIPDRLARHAVWERDNSRRWIAKDEIVQRYFLLIAGDAVPDQAYRRAVRFHWHRFGRVEQSRAAFQQSGTDSYRGLGLWDQWRTRVWLEETAHEWLEVPLADGSRGGGVRQQRWGPGPSVYLGSWFNAMRTAVGMAEHARRSSHAPTAERARQTLRLALGAPGRDGAFKCVAVPQENGVVWAAGDGHGASTEDGFLGYDMSWTGYWLLRWLAAGFQDSDAVLPRCKALAVFFVARQHEDGLLPTVFDERATDIRERSRLLRAETGPVALFLLEFTSRTGDRASLEAALRGLEFLEREVVAPRKWWDFETFWSCSPRDESFDERSRQWPANNLAMGQATLAMLRAFEITGQSRWLASGRALLDYLLLTQQCWTNPAIDGLTYDAMLLGGFTTQNSDAEWSDARQSQLGEVLLSYYRVTGEPELLSRGVAALRAQFPVNPSENWAHEGRGAKAGKSSFHWGTGSGMAGIELAEEFLRDVVLDVPSSMLVGVNGIDGTATVVGDLIEIVMSSPFQWDRAPVLVGHGGHLPSYRLQCNGVDLGRIERTILQTGVTLVIPGVTAVPRIIP